jgi:hypothetical protein
MKILIQTLIFALLISYSTGNAQIIKEVSKVLGNTGGFTEKEAADGIKEALINGTNNSTQLVSKVDGYFKNPEIKIPFPMDAKVVDTKLRSVGMGKEVDKTILAINRAAENAAKEAAPIFIDAIKNMTITDALNIVKGDKNSATKYLENSTSSALTAKFRPIISKSLDKTNATRYWSQIMKSYNKLPFVEKINPDLAGYVTSKAIQGLFIMIAKEELKIREDPLARTTELLKKVFGK